MTNNNIADPVLLLNAHVDDELGVADALAFEKTLANHPELAAERARISALRAAIAGKLGREPMPPGLRARVVASLGLKDADRNGSWRAIAASVALTALLAGSVGWFLLQSAASDAAVDSVVTSHMRALMAPQPTDVSSSDRHTVKPWFNGRIAESPRVIDLTDQGFPLVGGRIDVINRVPAPALVYRHRQHLISLIAMTERTAGRGDASETAYVRDGYNLLRWREKGVEYWAVSDLGTADLDAFARAFRAASR